MKQARTNAGINQRDISSRFSLTNLSYSNYENGYIEPPIETILKLYNALGITLNDLLEIKITSINLLLYTLLLIFSILIDSDHRGLQILDQMQSHQHHHLYLLA